MKLYIFIEIQQSDRHSEFQQIALFTSIRVTPCILQRELRSHRISGFNGEQVPLENSRNPLGVVPGLWTKKRGRPKNGLDGR